jgi:hypothetical protein
LAKAVLVHQPLLQTVLHTAMEQVLYKLLLLQVLLTKLGQIKFLQQLMRVYLYGPRLLMEARSK